MKHISGFDDIFETSAWYFWGNMKVNLRHLDQGLDTRGPHSDPADKHFLGSAYCQQYFYMMKAFVKNGVKISVTGSCTIWFYFVLRLLKFRYVYGVCPHLFD